MRTSRIALVVVAVLLAAIPVAGLIVAATVTVAENEIEWAASNGEEIGFIGTDATSVFFIRDDALETTKSGTAVFSGIPANSKFFNIATGAAGVNSPGSTTGVTRTLFATGYDTTTPANTPLSAFPTASVGTTVFFVVSTNLTAGTFTLIAGANATTTASFNYHTVDSWPGTTTASLRRAKVFSTSDPAGEWVTISEVASATDSTPSATSRLFRGEIALSPDAAKAGTNNDGVWVQDGDTVTVNYVDSNGTVIDSDAITADGVKPTISNVSPADGTFTNVANPTVVADITDTGSGMSPTNFSSDIRLRINGTLVSTGSVSFQAIANGFRLIFAQGTSWTNATSSGGFNVFDSVAFGLSVTSTDVAENTQNVSTSMTIDRVNPVLSSAVTGSANTTLVVTFSDTTGLDASSVNVSDFTVSGATVTGAVVDPNDKNKVILTVSALASDAKPVITVSNVSDLAGNNVAANSQVTATDGIGSGITSVAIDKSLAVKDDVVTVTVDTHGRETGG